MLFILVHRYQRQNDRQKLLHELSKEFANISSTECVLGLEGDGLKKDLRYKFTVALTRHVPWRLPTVIEHDFATSDRLLFFSGGKGQISATVLHEALFWFRRIHRARCVGLLNDGDLYQMWRQALPFVTDGRYRFLRRYWGHEDVKVILDVAGWIVSYCYQQKLGVPLNYLCELAGSTAARVDPEFVDDLSQGIQPLLRNSIKASQLSAAQPGVPADERPPEAPARG